MTAQPVGITTTQKVTNGLRRGNREPSSQGRLASLDGLRAVAAYGVVATHVGFITGQTSGETVFSRFLFRLDFGVALFFLLSGFLLYRPFVAAVASGKQAVDIRRYGINRILRILPAYWVALTVIFLVVGRGYLSTREQLQYYFLIRIYFRPESFNHPMLSQMWSLGTEMSFYILLPLLAIYGTRGVTRSTLIARNVKLIVGMMVVSALFIAAVFGSGWLNSDSENFYPEPVQWAFAHFNWFGAGMALAVLREGDRANILPAPMARFVTIVRQNPGWTLLLGAIIFAGAVSSVSGAYALETPVAFDWNAKHWLYMLAATFLLAPFALGDGNTLYEAVLSNRLLRFLGEVSYSVFLIHLLVLDLCLRALGIAIFEGHFWLMYFVTCVVSTAVAWVMYRLVELPTMNFSRELFKYVDIISQTRQGASQRSLE